MRRSKREVFIVLLYGIVAIVIGDMVRQGIDLALVRSTIAVIVIASAVTADFLWGAVVYTMDEVTIARHGFKFFDDTPSSLYARCFVSGLFLFGFTLTPISDYCGGLSVWQADERIMEIIVQFALIVSSLPFLYETGRAMGDSKNPEVA